MTIKRTAVVLFFIAAFGVFTAAKGMGPPPPDLTLLVMPERYSVIQTGFDIRSQRPVVLVAYRGEPDTDNPVLHVWNGEYWHNITMDDYKSADFLRVQPGRVILIGDMDTLPEVLVTESEWAPQVMNIPEMDSVSLINAIGRTLDFSAREWRWFAGRYNLEMEDLAEDRRRVSWYDQAQFEDPEWLRRRERREAAERHYPPPVDDPPPVDEDDDEEPVEPEEPEVVPAEPDIRPLTDPVTEDEAPIK